MTSAVRRVFLPEPSSGAVSCPLPVPVGYRAGISLAAAGDMRLSRAQTSPFRGELLACLDIAPDRLYAVHQVHSRRVEAVDGQSASDMTGQDADGLVTSRPDVVLSVTVADCLPIFLVHAPSGAFGVVHSGWRGTGIVTEALSQLRSRFGCPAPEVAAVIGPGIGPCCYTVAPDRAGLFVSRYGPETVQEHGGQTRLDLCAANVLLLKQAGVQDISVTTDCTSCTPWLGSFRRQGASEYTLMLAWIRRAGGGVTP